MVEVSRRRFLSGAVAAAGVVAAAGEEKITDGGYAEVAWPVEPARTRPILPPGAADAATFARRCVGCKLCVAQCPNGTLRVDRGLLPQMHFDRGYCRPECTACGEACPAGAIRRFTPQEKKTLRIGRATWHPERCVAAEEGVTCTACQRHCPAGAITLVASGGGAGAPKVPRVEASKCIGCGACEHLCPARPLPAMTVDGADEI